MTVIQHIDQLLELHDAAFVEAAYQALLGRAPDSEGMRYYLSCVRRGISKIRILGQIRNSSEGKLRNIDITGLDTAIRRQAWLALPVIGVLLRVLGFKEEEVGTQQKLRAIENQLHVLSEEIRTRFYLTQQIENTLSTVPEPEEITLTSRARDIYRQLKVAVARRHRGVN